jgi:hypothetical protein
MTDWLVAFGPILPPAIGRFAGALIARMAHIDTNPEAEASLATLAKAANDIGHPEWFSFEEIGRAHV